MAALKLVLDDAFDYDFSLIALHCSLESYRLAFMINKYAHLRLKRAKDIDFYNDQHKFSFASYKFEDQKKYQTYTLLSNKYKMRYKQVQLGSDLFAEADSEHFKTLNLVPEVKNADFLLKIESDNGISPKLALLPHLNLIPQIITAYEVEVSTIKSKQNLIFE